MLDVRERLEDRELEEYPHCPVCGEECEKVYRNRDFEIVGCDCCLDDLDAWGVKDCFSEEVWG